MARVCAGCFLRAFAWICIFAKSASPALGFCTTNYSARQDLGAIQTAQITEASGIAPSRLNPGVYWIHNDSGDQNRIYAIGPGGVHLATVYLNGFAARDWEDIASGPGPVDGVSYLYVGNIGDNSAQYPLKYIARFPEPELAYTGQPVTSAVASVDTITYQYPDGARDAETLLVDARTRDVYVVSKRETSVRVYRLAYPQSTGSTVTAEVVSTQAFTWAVGGDISEGGDAILIKTLGILYRWCRSEGQSVAQALAQPPATLRYTVESQGEAVCWRNDNAGYITVSEGAGAHLYFYPDADRPQSQQVRIYSQADAAGNMNLAWFSSSGHGYTLWQTTNLQAGFTSMITGITSTPPFNLLVVTQGVASSSFFLLTDNY